MKKLMRVLLLALAAILLFGAVTASAFESYDTYTYSIDGEVLLSPTAYTANQTVDSTAMKLTSKFGGLTLNKASDLVTDAYGNVYIADTGNNRIVILNTSYEVTAVITGYTDEYGRAQTFNGPQGVFVTNPELASTPEEREEGVKIYVCDTGNRRISVFDKNYEYVRTYGCPETKLLDANDYVPKAIAVDKYGRIFVISESCGKGVIVMSSEGDFTGFIGAQKVTYSAIQIFWRRFQSREQIRNSVKNVSTSYNNITVDDDGFVYVTSTSIATSKQEENITTKSADYSPVKKLNSAGDEIMKRNGFFDPGGEVKIQFLEKKATSGVSRIIDATVGPEGSWSILDSLRSRIFTYDSNGNLLFAFGDKGNQLGNGTNLKACAYQPVTNDDGTVYRILTLDWTDSSVNVTVYIPSVYCDTIMSALRNANEHNYSESINYWQEVLTRNNNFDLAYIGIGKALYSQGKYEEAMEMLSAAYETTNYSNAFAAKRKAILGKWLLPIVILIIAVVVLFLKFLGYAKKKNRATSLKVGRKTYGEELLYCCHLIFHPFDGFWDLKHEKRGSVRAALTILGATILAFFYQGIGRGYIFNSRGEYSTIFVQLAAILVPVLLWVVANWCLTTLFDGEGSFKDIFIATCYSLTPLPFFVILSTILSNTMTVTEGAIVTMLVTIGYVWVGMLLFFGMLVTHDYSLGKNVLITLCTLVAMMVIMFVAILFSSLVVKMVTFISAIITEIANRA